MSFRVNLSLTQDSKSESGKSGNFTEILDLGSDRTIVFLRGSQLIRSFSMQQTLHWVQDKKEGKKPDFFFFFNILFLLIRKKRFFHLLMHSELVFRNPFRKFCTMDIQCTVGLLTYHQIFSSDASGKTQIASCRSVEMDAI